MNHTIRLVPVLLFASLSPFAQAAEQGALKDKTLVAWVAPANLAQRGGSVLTLEDQQDHFDGIVFGEIAPAKWMEIHVATTGNDSHEGSESKPSGPFRPPPGRPSPATR